MSPDFRAVSECNRRDERRWWRGAIEQRHEYRVRYSDVATFLIGINDVMGKLQRVSENVL